MQILINIFLVLLILITVSIGAYTFKFQRATLYIGKKLAGGNPYLPTGFQNSITPTIQTIRFIISIILFIITVAYCFIFFKWYLALVFIIVMFIATSIVMAFLPKEDSDYFKKKIKTGLLKRKLHYMNIGDDEKDEAIDYILMQFEERL
jgi:hypothetical protein